MRVLGAESCQLLTDYGVGTLTSLCKKLTFLSLDFSRITDSSLYTIARNCSVLCELYLNGCLSVSDEGIAALAHGCPQLTNLGVEQCPLVTDRALMALGQYASNLLVLGLNENEHLTQQGIRALLQGCVGLKALYLNKTWIHDDCLRTIAEYGLQLEQLGLNHCESITDEGFVFLTQCQRLRYLHVMACPSVSQQAIQSLKRQRRRLKVYKDQEY